jgi:HK97 gp10 family phage protein
MKINYELEGLEHLIVRLEDMAKENVEEALGKACAVVERAAKENAPKGDGALRRSITSKVENNEGIVFTTLEYAPYVEYGTGLFAEGGNGRKDVPWRYQDDKGEWHTTSGMKPHPYLRPALEDNREKILEIFKEDITE